MPTPSPHVIANQSADWCSNPFSPVEALGKRKYLVMPPAGSFSVRGKGTKRRFFHVRTAKRRRRGRGRRSPNRCSAPRFVLDSVCQPAAITRAHPLAVDPPGVHHPSLVVGPLTGGIYAAPTEGIRSCSVGDAYMRPASGPRVCTGIKLHAQYCAPRSQATACAHEVFVHHFRLPRRGEKMAHPVCRYAFA